MVETAPDGGLILAATQRPFNAEDADHLQAAQRIAAAVAHLNPMHSSASAPAANPLPPLNGHHSMNLYEPRDMMWTGRVLTTIIPDQALYPDATNRFVVGRVGPPDDAWARDHGPRAHSAEDV